MRKITMGDPAITEEEAEIAKQVLMSGNLVKGPQALELEKNFAEFVGAKYAVTCSSGTDALLLALSAYDVGMGDFVITTSFSFFATASQATRLGAHVKFADIDPRTFNLCPKSVENVIESLLWMWEDNAYPESSLHMTLKEMSAFSDQSKIIILPVHLYGQSADIGAFEALKEKYPHIPIIILEDACQAHGAVYKDMPVGSYNTACWSLFPTKNLPCGGEGGIVTTNDYSIAEKMRLLANHGQTKRYQHDLIGWNSRLSEVFAAIANHRLKSLASANARRQHNAKQYNKLLTRFEGIILPYVSPDCEHVYHQYTIRVTNFCPVSKEALRHQLNLKGIGTGVHYPIPIHKQPVYADNYRYLELPNAQQLTEEVLSLPVHAGITDNDISRVVEVIALEYNKRYCLGD